MPNDTLRPFSLPTIGRKKLTEEIEVLLVHILLLARKDGRAEDGHGGAGRHQDRRQCQPNPGGDEAYSGRNRR
jgi:hypothetical protein